MMHISAEVAAGVDTGEHERRVGHELRHRDPHAVCWRAPHAKSPPSEFLDAIAQVDTDAEDVCKMAAEASEGVWAILETLAARAAGRPCVSC